MANDSLGQAKKVKNDEFYTVFDYIQKEMNAYLEYNPDVFRGKTVLLPCDDPEWSNFTKYFAQNFEMLGLKKLISTSYSNDSKEKQYGQYHQITLFEINFPQYDEEKSHSRGKIFTLTRDKNKSGNIDINDLEWEYMEGDGDFRSDEVRALRDEADIIVTNPPFSLFREFVAWVMEANKKIIVIGNQNAITYKEIFPLLKDNKLWIGATNNGQDMVFEVPEGAVVAPKDREKAEKLGYKGNYTRLGNACWFTNIDHGRRHQPLALMTMADNLKFSKHKQIREQGYLKYDNYDAIEVPFVDAIPSDYFADMGVPITYLDKNNEEQFEIVGADYEVAQPVELDDGKKGIGRFYLKKSIDTQDIEDNALAEQSRAEQSRAEQSRAEQSRAEQSRAACQTLQSACHTQEDVAELWEYQSLSLKSSAQSSLKSSEQQKVRARASHADCGIQKAELHNQSFRAREDIRDCLSDIRCNGVMGVPITFLDKYNPEQFEILGITLGNTVNYPMTVIYENALQHNKDGSTQGGSKVNTRAAILVKDKPAGTVYYTADNADGYLMSIYPRILIRRKIGSGV